jgi:hypothetical protein
MLEPGNAKEGRTKEEEWEKKAMIARPKYGQI